MVRKATLNDLEPLAFLFNEYRMFYGKQTDAEGAEAFLKTRIENQDSEIFVYEEFGNLKGFTQLFPLFSSVRMKKYWLMNDLFVEEYSRGKGFSKQLIEESKLVCQKSDACGILLETDKSNDIGNRLYPSCGFRIYEHANFYEWVNNEA